jgi:hypothetical protein
MIVSKEEMIVFGLIALIVRSPLPSPLLVFALVRMRVFIAAIQGSTILPLTSSATSHLALHLGCSKQGVMPHQYCPMAKHPTR